MIQDESLLFESRISLPQRDTAVWMTQEQLGDRLDMANWKVTHSRKISTQEIYRLHQQQSAALDIIIAQPVRPFASSGKCSAHREKGKEV